MSNNQSKIEELEARINTLVSTQIDFQKEITAIRSELIRLRTEDVGEQAGQREPSLYVPPAEAREPQPHQTPPRIVPPEQHRNEPDVSVPNFGYSVGNTPGGSRPRVESEFEKQFASYTENAKADIEKFIGENLISKIGIIVLIIGVGIGVKYSIDNNLISPLARIIVAYIFGFGLVGLAIKLKPKYLNFSAALISGGMAIMYFVTYFAYSAYGLIPQMSAFALMVLFTVFTVAAALFYNRQVIAHIGLVGAYAVPFLLSDNSGNYLVLFTYMSVINIGILAISVKKYWTPIFYTASGFTWLIFFGWLVSKYSPTDHFFLALTFVGIFATIFYATKLIHSAVHSEHDETESLISALATVFVFYAFTLAISTTAESLPQYWWMFGFVAIFGAALLFSSFRFYGRAILYLAFVFTWLIYGVWFADHYVAGHLVIASVFAVLFFVMFYAAVLAHRLVSGGLNIYENTGLVLTNAFLFYGFGYAILDSNPVMRHLLGAFTVAHAAMHYAIASVVGRLRKDSADVVQVLTILILTFVSIAVPVQFDGNFVTMIWAVEAALLFWFGRSKQIPVFEYFSFPVMVLAGCSMLMDWAIAYGDRTPRQPLANGDLVTALVFVAAFALIYVANRSKKDIAPFSADIVRGLGLAVATVGVFVLYNAFRIEIGNYYEMRAIRLGAADHGGVYSPAFDLDWFNTLWQLNYTIGFLIVLAVVNLRKIGSQLLALINMVLGAGALFVFATVAMRLFYDLRQSYLAAAVTEGAVADPMHIAIRYISYLFAAGLFYVLYRYISSGLIGDLVPEKILKLGFEASLCFFILIVASCDLLNLMAQFNIADGSKLGLSILWGVYALVLIAYGIARAKKHLRIGAIVLLGITLLKLFFYDAADLDTIPKTILFVTLGITLLIASFLYNKYKVIIFGSSAEQADDV